MNEGLRDRLQLEPTPEDCNSNAAIAVAIKGGRIVRGRACWYPQMGGYVGRALVVALDGCFDVYVWHDGRFPFSGDRESPCRIHHCDADQFIEFGKFLNSLHMEGGEGQSQEASKA